MNSGKKVTEGELNMDKRNDTLKMKHVNGHYVLFVNGVFFCSGDTYKECIDEYESSDE